MCDRDDTASAHPGTVPPSGLYELVSRVPLFACVNDLDMEKIVAITHHKTYSRGQFLFQQGDAGDEFLVVVEGRLKITFLHKDGRELTLAMLGPYQSLGEVSLIDDEPRSASAVALSPLCVLSINKRDFRALLESSPAICIALLATMGRRMRELTDDTAGLIFLDVIQRVARKLLYLADSIGVDRNGGREIAQPLTHQALAAMVGATRETVTKALKDLQTQGMISIRRRHITILAPLEMAKCAGRDRADTLNFG